MRAVAGALRVARGAIDALAAALLLAVLLAVAAQVVARYLLGVPMPWSEELTRLLFVWMVMIAAARASHMRIDVVVRALPRPARRAADLLTALLAGLLLALLARYGWDLVKLTAHDRYTALGLSVQWLYAALVVGTGLWIVLLVADAALGHERDAAPDAP